MYDFISISEGDCYACGMCIFSKGISMKPMQLPVFATVGYTLLTIGINLKYVAEICNKKSFQYITFA